MGIKRKLINIKMLGATQSHLNKFVSENKSFIFDETFTGIKYAMEKNKPIAEICDVNTTKSSIIIEKKGWENALSSSLGYFESIDEFEKCKEINLTLKLLRNGKRSTRLT